jgi:hypothetical protein
MKKVTQLRYGFSVCDFLFVDRPFFNIKEITIPPGETRQGKILTYGSSETGYSFQQIRKECTNVIAGF